MVIMVGHVHLSSAVAGYAVWCIELSCATATYPKGAGEGEVRVKNLDSMIITVPHIDLVIASIKCNASGKRKLETSTALGTNRGQILAFWCELLNTMIATINY
jgi:hypothetical protein